MKSPFYLVFPVTDIESTRIFYTGIIGCSVGREAKCWIDFNFFGYKISAHLAETLGGIPVNPVDGESVPARHLGLVSEDLRVKLVSKRHSLFLILVVMYLNLNHSGIVNNYLSQANIIR